MTEEELEREIAKVYRRASEETRQKLDNYTKTFERLDEQKKETLSEADYKEWRRRQITTGKRWEAVSNSLAMDVLKADNDARDIIKDYVPEAFADGYNYSCYQMAKGMGDNYVEGTFTLYDKEAVKYIVKENPDLLPQLKPNSPTAEKIRNGEIVRWNKQKINSEVTQGILQGESMSKIANRMQNVVGMEERSAMRNARTATNGARNAGKEESFKDAEELGIEVLQMWVASVDDRTRFEHRQLDGQTVKTDEKFKVDGYEIAYPCDPTAEPFLVYNCRCTVIPYLPKYSKEKPDAHQSVSEADYEAWKKEQPYHSQDKKEEPKTVTTYAKATTKDEAKTLLKDLGFTNVRGTDNISERLLVENTNQLASLDARFNALGNRSFIVRDIDGDELAYVNPKNGALNMNSNCYYNTRVQRNAVAETYKLNEEGRPQSMPVAKEYYDVAVLTHEYGHMLQQNIWEGMGYEKFGEDGKLTEEYRAWTKETANEIFSIVATNNPDTDPMTLWKEQVGTYAEVNTQEFFAECFMNANCGAPNDFGKALETWLERKGL